MEETAHFLARLPVRRPKNVTLVILDGAIRNRIVDV